MHPFMPRVHAYEILCGVYVSLCSSSASTVSDTLLFALTRAHLYKHMQSSGEFR